jgi:hypothetical protein
MLDRKRKDLAKRHQMGGTPESKAALREASREHAVVKERLTEAKEKKKRLEAKAHFDSAFLHRWKSSNQLTLNRFSMQTPRLVSRPIRRVPSVTRRPNTLV